MPYLFFLGRSRALAEAELMVFFPHAKPVSDGIIEVDEDFLECNGKKIPIEDSLKILAGTVKITCVLGVEKKLDPVALARHIINEKGSRTTFGFSTCNGVKSISSRECQTIKSLLETKGTHVRFILPRHGTQLSDVVVMKQGVFEITIIPVKDGYMLSKTICVQEFEEWSRRDTNRSDFDRKKGMLPMKVARMVVNIGLGKNAVGKTLLDPFCGMGTIPGEALLRGATALASDSSKEAVDGAKRNSILLRSHDKTLPPVTFFTSDAAHVSDSLQKESLDVIVTEPFMGSAKLGERKISNPQKIKNIMKGLEKLYIGCLRDWHRVLKPSGIVLIALPEIDIGNTKYSVKNVIDRCETLGYTRAQGPLPYSRPLAIVRRMFYVFKKN